MILEFTGYNNEHDLQPLLEVAMNAAAGQLFDVNYTLLKRILGTKKIKKNPG